MTLAAGMQALLLMTLALGASEVKPEKILVLHGSPTDLRLAVDATHIYMLDGGMLSRIPKDGGDFVKLADVGAGIGGQLQVVGEHVYWTELGRFQSPCGAIRRIQPGSKKPETVMRKLASPQSLVVDPQVFYWLDWKDGLVRKGARSGRSRRMADAGDGLSYLALNTTRMVGDAKYLYYTSVPQRPLPEPREAIYRLPKRGGEPVLLADRQRTPFVLAQDDTHLYWVSEYVVGNTGAIRRVPKTGGKIEDIAPITATFQLGIAGDHLYWIEAFYGKGYFLRRVRRSGGEVETIYESKRQSYFMALDDTHIYWVEHGHVEGECRQVYPGCGQNPMPPETVCDYPDGHILRLPLP